MKHQSPQLPAKLSELTFSLHVALNRTKAKNVVGVIVMEDLSELSAVMATMSWLCLTCAPSSGRPIAALNDGITSPVVQAILELEAFLLKWAPLGHSDVPTSILIEL